MLSSYRQWSRSNSATHEWCISPGHTQSTVTLDEATDRSTSEVVGGFATVRHAQAYSRCVVSCRSSTDDGQRRVRPAKLEAIILT